MCLPGLVDPVFPVGPTKNNIPWTGLVDPVFQYGPNKKQTIPLSGLVSPSVLDFYFPLFFVFRFQNIKQG